MKKLKTNKGMINFFKNFGIKKAFLTDDIRFDRNGAHHVGVDAVSYTHLTLPTKA